MIQGRDFVIVGLQSWDIEIGSNCKNIAMEIAKTNRVLYVNRPTHRITLLKMKNHEKVKRRREVLAGREKDLYQYNQNLWIFTPKTVVESINWISWPFLYDALNKINAQRVVSQINSAIQRLSFRQVIVFNDNDFLNYVYLKELLSPETYIYYIRDFLSSQDYFKKHGNLEKEVMTKADLILANSQYLSQYGATYNENSFFVGQGCDLSLLKKVSGRVPQDLQEIKRPIVGYTGALLSNRLDIEMIEHCAEYAPDYSFVLVGPEDKIFAESRLHYLSNVYFLGTKPPEGIPEYIQNFDVCINPQKVNDLTIGNYPRKIDEYLITGKPVVVMATEAMRFFEEYVYLAKDKLEFSILLKKAYQENTLMFEQKRKDFASSHTWEQCTKKIYSAIKEFQENKTS